MNKALPILETGWEGQRYRDCQKESEEKNRVSTSISISFSMADSFVYLKWFRFIEFCTLTLSSTSMIIL